MQAVVFKKRVLVWSAVETCSTSCLGTCCVQPLRSVVSVVETDTTVSEVRASFAEGTCKKGCACEARDLVLLDVREGDELEPRALVSSAVFET